MLEEVKIHTSNLFPFVYSVYERPSYLFYKNDILLSQEGVQQGDPLGPLLFCLAIHPLVERLKSTFKVFYMDDATIGGTPVLLMKCWKILGL